MASKLDIGTGQGFFLSEHPDFHGIDLIKPKEYLGKNITTELEKFLRKDPNNISLKNCLRYLKNEDLKNSVRDKIIQSDVTSFLKTQPAGNIEAINASYFFNNLFFDGFEIMKIFSKIIAHQGTVTITQDSESLKCWKEVLENYGFSIDKIVPLKNPKTPWEFIHIFDEKLKSSLPGHPAVLTASMNI